MTGVAKRVALEVVGWLLVLAGIAAIALPGPGLLMLFAGLAVLSQRYTWAERRVRPVERAALKAASDSVQTWPRVGLAVLGGAWLIGLGVLWGLQPPAPSWWPVADRWWLAGGWGPGITLIASGLLAWGMIGYSLRRFRGSPYRPGEGSGSGAEGAVASGEDPPDLPPDLPSYRQVLPGGRLQVTDEGVLWVDGSAGMGLLVAAGAQLRLLEVGRDGAASTLTAHLDGAGDAPARLELGPLAALGLTQEELLRQAQEAGYPVRVQLA